MGDVINPFKRQDRLLKNLYYLEAAGLKSSARGIMLQKAIARTPATDDVDSWLGDYADWFVSLHLEDPAFQPIVEWAREHFGLCRCGKILNQEDNAWQSAWLQDATGEYGAYCSDACVDSDMKRLFRVMAEGLLHDHAEVRSDDYRVTELAAYLWNSEIYDYRDLQEVFRHFQESR